MSKNLHIEETLVFYDVPHVLVAKNGQEMMLCMLVDEDEMEYLAVQISTTQLNAVKEGRADLRTIYLNPEQKMWFSVKGFDGASQITSHKFQQPPEEYLPEKGFFLTEPSKNVATVNNENPKTRLVLDEEGEIISVKAKMLRVFASLLREMGLPGFMAIVLIVVFLIWSSTEQKQDFFNKYILLKNWQSDPIYVIISCTFIFFVVGIGFYYNRKVIKLHKKNNIRFIEENDELQQRLLNQRSPNQS